MINWEELADIFGYSNEEEMLKDLYTNQGLSIQVISDKLEARKPTILRRLELYNIPKRKRGGANNKSQRRVLLHLLDQRYLRVQTIEEIARVVNAHPTTVWKYRRGE